MHALPTSIGAYSIVAQLGVGGMGRVYLARDSQGQEVALKVLLPELTAATLDRLRFEREFDIASSLDHPGLVRVYQRYCHNDICYYSMEHVEGQDLARSFELPAGQNGSLAQSQLALKLFTQVADALHYLHGHNIIHRDLKAENVLVDPRQQVRLLDFGLACFHKVASKANRLTSPGMVLGTPYAMAPEQIVGDGADVRSDLYSLGIMLYQVFCQKLPFEASDPMAVLYQILNQPTPEFQPRLLSPPGLAELVEELLRKEPHQRPREAGEVRQRLEALQSHWQGQAPELVSSRPWVPEALQRLASPRAIPRPSEQAWFEHRLEQLLQRRGGWGLLAGPAGVGKTFLLSQWANSARAQALTTLRTQPAPGSRIPYQVWLPLLRWALEGEVAEVIQPFRSALSLLLPELGPGREPFHDDPLQRYHLYEGMARLLQWRCQQPTVLLLDHLEEADPASLDFLHYFLETRYFSAEAFHLPFLVLALSSEDSPDKELDALNRLAEQQAAASRFVLNGFSLEETQVFLESLLEEQPLHPDSLKHLHQETEGKALYLLELARLGIEGGAWEWRQGCWNFKPSSGAGSWGSGAPRLPARLQHALKKRLDNLEEPALEVLRIAAILGPLLAFRHLQNLCGLPDRQLYDLCSRLVQRRLLHEHSDFSLASLGTAEVVLESMSWEVRRSYHARTAAYLESEPSGCGQLSWEIAGHWSLAGQPERAGQAYLDAARQALRGYAYDEACRCLQEISLLPPQTQPLPSGPLEELWADAMVGAGFAQPALEKLQQLLLPAASDSLDQIRRLRKAGGALEMMGQLAEAHRVHRQALSLLNQVSIQGPRSQEILQEGSRLCERQSRVLFSLRPPGWLNQLSQLLLWQIRLAWRRESWQDRHETLAQAMIYGGFWSLRRLHWRRGAHLGVRQALSRLEKLPESLEKASLLADTGYLMLFAGSTRPARRVLEQALDILQRQGAVSGLCKVHLQLHAVLFHQGQIGLANQQGYLGLQQARRLDNRFEEALALSDLLQSCSALGDLAAAQECLQQLVPLRENFQASYLDLIAEIGLCNYLWASRQWSELVQRSLAIYRRCRSEGELPHHLLQFGLLAVEGQLQLDARMAAPLLKEIDIASQGQRLFRPAYQRLRAQALMLTDQRTAAFDLLSQCCLQAERSGSLWECYRSHSLMAEWLEAEGLGQHHRHLARLTAQELGLHHYE